MFHRIVSLALILCFLPLPNANSVVAWEMTIFAADSTWSESSDSDDSESDGIPDGRLCHHPITIDSESLVFCEMENEVREKESKDGEEKSYALAEWCVLPSKLVPGNASRNGISGSLHGHSADIASRYHILRC